MEESKREPEWLDRVKSTNRYHKERLRENHKHTIAKTAKSLKRSLGSVAQELKVAQWLKTHERELLECEYFHEAIEFVRDKQHQLEIEE